MILGHLYIKPCAAFLRDGGHFDTIKKFDDFQHAIIEYGKIAPNEDDLDNVKNARRTREFSGSECEFVSRGDKSFWGIEKIKVI